MVKLISTTQFIIEASIAHHFKYTYLKTHYVNLYSNVTVTCPTHGDFEIYARNHARRGQGCQKCALYKRGRASSKEFELAFVKRANIIHNNIYTYLQIPKQNRERINILCPKHGVFTQYALSHLQGYGCKYCSIEKLKKNPSAQRGGWNVSRWKELASRSNYFDGFKLYKVQLFNNKESFYKIGRTFQPVEKRLSTIPYHFDILSIVKSSAEDIFNMELELKKKLKPFKYTPALNFKGQTECYSQL